MVATTSSIVGIVTLSIGYKVLQGTNPFYKGSKALQVRLGGINDNLWGHCKSMLASMTISSIEGRYIVVYTYDFVLLAHPRHGILVNMPYYLLNSLQNMAHYVRKAKFLQGYLTNHGLIKLIILRESQKRYQ